MFSKLPRNLPPAFRPSSIMPFRVREIVEEVLDTPIKIPNYLGFDNPEVHIEKQISPFKNTKHVAEYQNVDVLSLNRYFNNYKKNRE